MRSDGRVEWFGRFLVRVYGSATRTLRSSESVALWQKFVAAGFFDSPPMLGDSPEHCSTLHADGPYIELSAATSQRAHTVLIDVGCADPEPLRLVELSDLIYTQSGAVEFYGEAADCAIETRSKLEYARGSALPMDVSVFEALITETLRLAPNPVSIRLHGHSSADEPSAIARQRASALRDAFHEAGVDLQRLEIRGHGATRPIDTNKTDAGRRANRRVDVEIRTRQCCERFHFLDADKACDPALPMNAQTTAGQHFP